MKQFLFVLATGLAFASCQQPTETQSNVQPTVRTDAQLVERGRYLVSIMGCNDCHTSHIMTPHGPDLDPDRILAGHPEDMPLPPYDEETTKGWVLFSMNFTAMRGPWGVSFAANLTPDSTGIKFWTEEQFFRAMRHGDSKGLEGNRKILPPMPWEVYKNATDEDLKSIFAYLKSIKPVKNAVPQPIPPSMASL